MSHTTESKMYSVRMALENIKLKISVGINIKCDIQSIETDLDDMLKQTEEIRISHPDYLNACFLDLLEACALLESLYEERRELPFAIIAIKYMQKTIEIAQVDYRDKILDLLGRLTVRFMDKYGHLGDFSDVDSAIDCHNRMISLGNKGSVDLPIKFTTYGTLHLQRFEGFGSMGDIKACVNFFSRALSLTPENHPELASRLSNLGVSYESRFQRLGDIDDLTKAIECKTRALTLVPENHPYFSSILGNLGSSYDTRFQRLGHLEDINKAIANHARAAALTPVDDVNLPIWLNNLGASYQQRFKRQGDLQDIREAIISLTRAVNLTPQDDAELSCRLNNLGIAHENRFQHLGHLNDIDKAVKSQIRAVEFTPEAHIELPSRLSNLGISYQSRFLRLGNLSDIDQAINLKMRALSLTPDDHPDLRSRLGNLGNAYEAKFQRFGHIGDIDKAVEYRARAITGTPEDHVDRADLYNNLGISYGTRFQRFRHVSDIDKAVEYETRAVALTPRGHASLATRMCNLGISHESRFQRFGSQFDAEKAIDYKTQAVMLTPDGHASLPIRLNSLGSSYQTRYRHTGNLDDIEKALEHKTRALSLTPQRDVNLPAWLSNLGNAYQLRFKHSENPEDIAKAIEYHTRAIELTPDDHASLPGWLNDLGHSYEAQFEFFKDILFLRKSLECFSKSSQSVTGSPQHRFDGARMWAKLSSAHSIPGHLAAYQTAMDLVPQLRYEDAKLIGDLAVEASAAAIDAQDCDLALEWLEQARSVVWSQTLQLRAPLDRLRSIQPTLADDLQQIANELHAFGSESYENNFPSQAHDLEQAAQIHRRSAEKYDILLTQVRQLPEFEDFLRPRKSAELLCAARSGPIVVINCHKYRCDALVLIPQSSSVAHIPLPNLSDSITRDISSQTGLLVRGYNLCRRDDTRRPLPEEDISQSDEFESILSTLWISIAKPVLDFLQCKRDWDSDKLIHITWCATGALSFLPLHAAGSYYHPQTKLSDFAISSYTPSISALLSTSRSFSLAHSTVLAIGQEATPGHSHLPGTTDEILSIGHHAQKFAHYTELAGHDATICSVLEAMEHSDCVHLACHAHQDVQEPSKSGFFLHDGMLSLAAIAQKSFADKKFAFLAACQTATGDKNIPDEAVHLASGMLIAGYPRVIATMWSVRDVDAPFVTKRVYDYLLKDKEREGPSVAKALHAAVGELRARVGEREFAHWVPYIHVGI